MDTPTCGCGNCDIYQHRSDCGVHNLPAYPTGYCSCAGTCSSGYTWNGTTTVPVPCDKRADWVIVPEDGGTPRVSCDDHVAWFLEYDNRVICLHPRDAVGKLRVD